MKYILTLLFSATMITAAFAQTDAEREEAKRIILGEKRESSYPKSNGDRDVFPGGDNRTVYGGRSNRYPERYPTSYGSARERRIYEINREYDARIYSIRQDRTLSRFRKDRIIRQLEAERRQRISQVNSRYYDNDRRYDRDAYKQDKRYKKNYGNHYGWERGKGNPHHGNW